MRVYEVFDNYIHGDFGEYFRNLKEAKEAFKHVENGYLSQIELCQPITKDMIIALLNHESYAVSNKTLKEKVDGRIVKNV